ncbi:CRISPR-associated protein Cas1 [Actinoalloteichus hoggarensis]|uniref:CRISPR-associated endonuclease Cas1 n=1 Tax=Actinoalloteichus hoggarensis TaxID=1470176 RepID=A0A221W7I1_9PSEU|nr:type I-B CRISPR-associated endonuclease Cas1b [Actinoalloteichus hoggarensis]ASO21586.1 CRISPR-associated endonuclease Cas1 [Actinoalloteichus hoggarensis]MBB5922178.1 CRISPR-associated protein Cas1 [Actinoalloteichus hoggarensis]
MPATSRTYWLTTPCRLRRQDDSIRVERDGHPPTFLPIEDVRDIIAAAEVDLNTSMMSLLNKHRIQIHILGYYGDYAGSFLPAETAVSGTVALNQMRLASDDEHALPIARALIDNAAFNIRWVIDRKLLTRSYGVLKESIAEATTREQLMAAEGNFRRSAWEVLDTRLPDWLQLDGRSRRPPRNAGNAVISYINGILYARILSALRLTPLHTGIAFLHATMQRHRHSLALDLAEVFKPLFAERILIRLANRRQLKPQHFDINTNQAMLSESGRKLIVQTVRDDLAETVKHRTLGRNVSYDELIYLDALALTRTCLEGSTYTPFRVWW